LTNEILHGPALDKLKTLDSESVDCCITSPPYWALRDYKTEGQLGLEPTFQEYITKLVDIFNEVRRVLKKSGACWVNMGDTYSGSGGAVGRKDTGKLAIPVESYSPNAIRTELPQKSLCLIPERFAIAMVDQGWILRNKIIWYKPNCMPSSAKDRFTVDWEYLFFFTKSQRYYFETQYEPQEVESGWAKQRALGINNKISQKWLDGLKDGSHTTKMHKWFSELEDVRPNPLGRIKRCVWKIATQPFSEAHFATFPPALVKTPLLATCPSDGTVLDPFMGAGTVALVALQNARNFVGIELSQDYINMAMKRLEPYLLQTRLG
jgi:DNA modification methylase